MGLDLAQSQVQTLSPQMIQSVKVLQMSTQELLEFLETTHQENPVLEFQENSDSADRECESDEWSQKLEWLESSDPQNCDYHRQDSDPNENFLRIMVSKKHITTAFITIYGSRYKMRV